MHNKNNFCSAGRADKMTLNFFALKKKLELIKESTKIYWTHVTNYDLERAGIIVIVYFCVFQSTCTAVHMGSAEGGGGGRGAIAHLWFYSLLLLACQLIGQSCTLMIIIPLYPIMIFATIFFSGRKIMCWRFGLIICIPGTFWRTRFQ